MLNFSVNYLLVAIEAKVVILRHYVGLGNTEALFGAWAFQFVIGTLRPPREHIGQIIP